MIDVSREELLPLREAARLFPSGRKPGKAVHIGTVYRWSLKGVKGVRLCTILVGGIRYTTLNSIAEFLRELNKGAESSLAPVDRDSIRVARTRSILGRLGT